MMQIVIDIDENVYTRPNYLLLYNVGLFYIEEWLEGGQLNGQQAKR